MKKRAWVMFFLLISMPIPGFADWVNVSGNLNEADTRLAVSDPRDPSVLFTASDKRLYRSPDGGKTWRQLFGLRGQDDRIHCIVIDAQNSEHVYVGTDKGLKASTDGGKHWSVLFSGVGNQINSVRCLALSDPKFLWIGTAEGLYALDTATRQADKIVSIPRVPIHSIVICEDAIKTILAATEKGFYQSRDHGKSWKLVFCKTGVTGEASESSLAQFTIEEFSTVPQYANIVFSGEKKCVYAATADGLLTAGSDENTWKTFEGQNLPDKKINYVECSPVALYAATDHGVFRWSEQEKRFDERYKGLLSKEVRHISYSARGDYLLAATKNGVYRFAHPDWQDAQNSLLPASGSRADLQVLQQFGSEPSIREIQMAAIRYAEVYPEKIEAWRNAATRKAWFPTLSAHTDMSRNQNVDLDRGGTGDPDHFIIGPDEKSFDSYFTVSWNLGDLIWNNDQTSIDTRSKLMVELRDDILNEVTHLYFERRRLQAQMVMSPDADPTIAVERQIRLEELTANIDALTGGYLSKRLIETQSSPRV